jgi:L-threonylcarbamoyladenylate synthase
VVAASDDAALQEATVLLRAGEVVAIPTDTVYGIAANPFCPGATKRLFAAKHRPRDVQVPVLVADADQALTLAVDAPEGAARLMERFWPGGLTIVLPRRPALEADLGEDDQTIGIRCPDHPAARRLCAEVGPLATTSANVHGGETPATATEVAALFGEEVPLVLDGGTCEGAPSTVVDCTGPEPRLLRDGRVPWPEVLAHYHRR